LADHLGHETDLAIRQIESSGDISDLAALEGLSDFLPGPIDWLRGIFNNGGVGFVALKDSKPVGCCWISFRIIPGLIRVPVPLAAGDAYLLSLFVSPAHQNKRYGRVLAAHRLRYLRQKGYKRGIITVHKDNAPALRVDRAVGYTDIGGVTHTRFLFWDSYRHHGDIARDQ